MLFRIVTGLCRLSVDRRNWSSGRPVTSRQNLSALTTSAFSWICKRAIMELRGTPIKPNHRMNSVIIVGSELMNVTRSRLFHGLDFEPSAQYAITPAMNSSR
ncbi:MAG TPA: hypothetical protein VJ922_06015 [Actinomycetota bacterium]|nr:hypothetical protein [Actinomycetota bacterium]